ncbi:hypothetical protein OG625_16245 [Streptomyces sp. NBC_01351]|uniref:hypothetical protein n=1 Tax=Streptomyces sp. NBC_01351 TaxID=2903833 RepID=UPI002E361861|nr:hypothetical protein [Streptomyces sp. NBC_01351]
MALAVGGWVVWLLPGPQLAAVVGVGPVDGVVRIDECHGASDAEGHSDGTGCTGWYTPRREDRPDREIVLDMAAERYEKGAEVEVRTANGKAYELSGYAVQELGTGAGLVLVPFLTLSAWLLASASRGRFGDGEGFFFAGLGGLILVIALGFVGGLVVGIGTAVF